MDYPSPPLSRRLLIALLGMILAALAVPAMAQSKYVVEVIIFRHWEAPGDDAEFWPHQPQPISRSAIQHLVTLGPVTSDADAPAFSRLPNTELQLAGIRERLEHSKDYKVLLHVGWRQPGLKPANAPAVVLPLNWSPPPLAKISATSLTDTVARGQNPFDYVPAGTQLWGTLRLLQQRYLHFQVDLRFRRDGLGDTPDAMTIYPMIQSRRMRAGEIHYLDHPVLGILVQARKLAHGRDE